MFTLRKAEVSDIPQLFALFTATTSHINIRDYTPQQIQAWQQKANLARWEELYHSDLDFIIAENEHHEMVGFTSINAKGYLHSMYVHYNFQRRGLASLLLAKAEQYAKQHNIIAITSDISLTARPFFDRAGYTVIKEQQVQIGDVMLTNFLMRKEIQ